MAAIRQEALDHQARRWLRPDWRRFFRPGAEGDPLHQYYERIERKYDPNQPRVPAGQSEGGWWTSAQVTILSQLHQTSADRALLKPKQAERSTTGSGATESKPTQIAGRISPTRQAECDEQYRKDTFICNSVRTQSCWEQAAFRLSQCLKGGYIPPIYH
jgi:hypothetical protein